MFPLRVFKCKISANIILATILPLILDSAAAQTTNLLGSGIRLEQGQSIYSLERKYRLTMQTNGSLYMLRSDGTIRFRGGDNGWFAVMQSDGNFVHYNGAMNAIFNTETYGHPGAELYVQDDGNLVIYQYTPTRVPIWNIGAEPGPSDPKKVADVVGRDLKVAVGGFLGHLGLYDGSSSVIEAGPGSNAIQVVSFNQFKGETPNFWGTASPNIPSGHAVPSCFDAWCSVQGDTYQDLEMRTAIIKKAYQAQLIGSDYTITATWKPAAWGDQNVLATRGVYRCDTFVLASMYMTARYKTPATTVQNNWTNFIQGAGWASIATPSVVFDKMKAYQ